MRLFIAIVALLLLSGCTAMILGDGGGYTPPAEDCRNSDDERCRK